VKPRKRQKTLPNFQNLGKLHSTSKTHIVHHARRAAYQEQVCSFVSASISQTRNFWKRRIKPALRPRSRLLVWDEESLRDSAGSSPQRRQAESRPAESVHRTGHFSRHHHVRAGSAPFLAKHSTTGQQATPWQTDFLRHANCRIDDASNLRLTFRFQTVFDSLSTFLAGLS
jgi:hypothetical protein